jgi:RHS repeat-associated protein
VSVDGIIVLSDARYEPFGPVSGWTWGNGTSTTRFYDLDGNPARVESAGRNTYSYDDAFRITTIADLDESTRSWAYGYDAVDRLSSAARSGLSQSWSYDANGNRLTQGGTSTSTYAMATTSNRLLSVSGATSRTYAYANSGQVISDGQHTFTYNDAGRMTAVTGAASATYVYNALGQRIKKTASGVTTYFLYDEAGRLIGEYGESGTLIQEIVWLNDVPVASLRDCSCGDAIFYVHTDHLNTPRRVTKRSTTTVVWRWDSDPFGTSGADTDPDGDGTHFSFNLRFPGQYFDSETGLNYNYMRDYEAATGRYIQSDPLGLRAG